MRVIGMGPSEDEQAYQFIKLRPVPIGQNLLRIGPKKDGGYVLVDDLDGITQLFSPGVGGEFGFDLEIAGRGIECHLLDGSPNISLVPHPNIKFTKAWLGPVSSEQAIGLEDWVRSRATSDNLLLQMDVEGDEYAVLEATNTATLALFRQIVVEFHGLHALFMRDGLKRFSTVLDKLLAGHVPVHIHPNDCCPSLDLGHMVLPDVLEATFARLDRVRILARPVRDSSHILDFPNTRLFNTKVQWPPH